MRHSATRAILERDDVIVVASRSAVVYGIGSVETYSAMTFTLKPGQKVSEKQLMADLVAQQYPRRNDNAFERGTFRRRGDTLEIFPRPLRGPRLARHPVRRRGGADPASSTR